MTVGQRVYLETNLAPPRRSLWSPRSQTCLQTYRTGLSKKTHTQKKNTNTQNLVLCHWNCVLERNIWNISWGRFLLWTTHFSPSAPATPRAAQSRCSSRFGQLARNCGACYTPRNTELRGSCVRPGSFVGSPGTNQTQLQFTDVVFILVPGKVPQLWTQSARAHTGSPSEWARWWFLTHSYLLGSVTAKSRGWTWRIRISLARE